MIDLAEVLKIIHSPMNKTTKIAIGVDDKEPPILILEYIDENGLLRVKKI